MALTKVKGAVLEPLTVTDVAAGSISADDGTEAATIADVTGVMTIGSSVLTSADINGGTIDGTTIGATTPAAGTFTQANFGDNEKAIFGAGSDLQIYHNGTDSFIKDLGTGNLYLDSDGPGLYLRVNSTQTALAALNTGEVSLRYATAEKLGTTATGVNVTGNVVSDGADLDGAVTINESGADVDFRVESDTNQYALFVQGSDSRVGINTSNPLYDLHVADGSGGAVSAASIGFALDPAASNGYSAINFSSRSSDTDSQAIIQTDYLAGLTYNSPNKHYFKHNSVDVLTIYSNVVVVNEPGNDVDFRVESDTNTHALFVQGSDGHVGIGITPASDRALHVSDANGILIESTGSSGIHKFVRGTAATADSRPVIDIDLDTTNDAADGFGPMLRFTISDTAVDDSELGAIGFVRDGGDGLGKFVVGQDSQQLGSGGQSQFSVSNSEAVFNERSADVDFRVESDTNTHALFVDGGNSRVGINTATPGGPFEVGVTTGTSGASSGLRVISEDGGGWAIYPASAVANPVWTTNVNSSESYSWSVGGSNRMSLANGMQLGTPTGGDKGIGSLNALAVYDDNTLLTDFVLDQAVDGEIDYDFYDGLELGGKAAREWDPRNLDIDHYEAQWRERKALPSFRSKAERFDDNGNEIRDSMGTLIQGLQQELETAMVHIAQLNARIKRLEEK
jgi:hypothetical protein